MAGGNVGDRDIEGQGMDMGQGMVLGHGQGTRGDGGGTPMGVGTAEGVGEEHLEVGKGASGGWEGGGHK